MKKRILAAMLASVMALGLFAGCQSSPDVSGSSQESSSGQEKSSGAGTAPENDGAPVPLKICAWDWGKVKNTDAEQQIIDKLEKENNVDLTIEWIPGDTYESKMSLKFAGNEEFDIYQDFGPTEWGPKMERGEILDLNPYLDEYGQNFKDPELMPEDFIRWGTYKGKLCGLPSGAVTGARHIVTVRQDWLDQLNLSVPKTMDEFENYMAKVKETDLNGNGKNDEIPLFTGAWIGSASIKQYFLKYGNSPFIDENGVYCDPILDPNYELYLETMQKWYNNGWIWSEAYTCEAAQAREMEAKDVFGAFAFWYDEGSGAETLIKQVNPDTKASYVFANPEGPGLNKLWEWNRNNKMVCINAKTKYPEAAVSLLNWSIGKDAAIALWYGNEGLNYKYVDDEKTTVEKIPDSGYEGAFQSIFTDANYPKIPKEKGLESLYNLLDEINAADKQLSMGCFYSYDTSSWESAGVINDLDTFIEENEIQILTGVKPASEWGNIIEQWRSMGGDLLMQEYGKAFNEFESQE